MGQAQQKAESVQGRTVLPPPLPTRSGIAPKAARASAAAPARASRSLPPAPPLAALNSASAPKSPLAALNSVPAPKSPLPASDLELAILPQWADANAPLLPAKKRRFGLGFWIGSTTASLAVGALVAAGLMGARLPESAHTSQPQPLAIVAHAPAPTQSAAAEATPDMEIATEEAFAQEHVATAPTTVLVPELTVTASKLTKQSAKRGKISAGSKPNTRSGGKAAKAADVVSKSWQPDPAAEATEAPAAEATTTEAAPAAEAESAPAPEPVAAPEPPKPVLPEQLSREQVRQGMESKRAAVITCAKGGYGRVLADVTISQSGKVTSSLIDGTFAGTSVGSCMAGALRGVQFPAFSGPEIQVRYPFNF
jgi:hypothetical protein